MDNEIQLIEALTELLSQQISTETRAQAEELLRNVMAKLKPYFVKIDIKQPE